MLLFSTITIIASLSSFAQAFQLYHRVLHPSSPENPFVKRGSILLSDPTGNTRIQSTSTVQHDLPLAETSAHVTDALYQLALDPGKSDSLWLISSIKACHLAHATDEHIVVHLPSPGGTPFALDYFLDPIPLDGTCPPSQVFSPTLALPQNATITFSHPGQPPLFVIIVLIPDRRLNIPYRPELRVPPPLTATGDPVPLVPDKSMVQKYWLFIVVVLGALLIAPPSGEEGPQAS
ncbi:hypothetical protein BJV78DRAFT_1282540 [Lactifluus subvellereus]|nr:hypothetical protein BJV78DRAFT_1282540 [Lactifluus subvellereus]